MAKSTSKKNVHKPGRPEPRPVKVHPPGFTPQPGKGPKK